MEQISKKRKAITALLAFLLISFGIVGGIKTSLAEDYEKIKLTWTLVDISNKEIPGMADDSYKEVYVKKSDKEKLKGYYDLGRVCTATMKVYPADGSTEEVKDADMTEAMKLLKSGGIYADSSGSKAYKYDDLKHNLKTVKENTDDANKAIKPGIMERIIKSLFKLKITNPLDGKKIEFFNIGPTCEKMLLFGHVDKDESLGLSQDSGITDATQITDIAKAVNKSIAFVGNALAITGMIMYLLREAFEHYKNIRADKVAFIFMRGILWCALANGSWYLMSKLMDAGDWIALILLKLAKIKTDSSANRVSSLADSVAGFLTQQSLLNKVVSFVLCMALWFMCIGTAVAIFTFVASRAIRILINIAFAPIPIALCSYDKTRPAGRAYLMNMLSAGIEASIIFMFLIFYMMAVNSVGSDLTGSVGDGSLGNMLKYLLYIITLNTILAAAVRTSTQMARDMLGA